jgi:acetolactate synthase-1/2/3 large subunit
MNRWRDTYPLGYDEPADGTLAPQYVIEQLGRIAGSDAIYVAGVGQHQMWAAQFVSYEKPGTWINSASAPWASCPPRWAPGGPSEATVWSIDGDGCFQMTNQELATCALEGIPSRWP